MVGSGHVERMGKDSLVRKSREMVVEGHWGIGRSRKILASRFPSPMQHKHSVPHKFLPYTSVIFSPLGACVLGTDLWQMLPGHLILVVSDPKIILR